MAVRGVTTGATSSLAPISSQLYQLHPGGCPTGVEPRQWRKLLKSRVRSHLAIVTGLLALLDDMDGDADLEDGGDLEPSLSGWEINGEVDLEADPLDQGEADFGGRFGASGFADDEPNVDDEVSVGVDYPEAQMTEWSERHPIQIVPGPGQ